MSDVCEKFYLPLKLRFLVDDITALSKGRNQEVEEVAKKVMQKLKEEVEKKGLKLSVTENGNEGKSKMIASCGFLEEELRQFSEEGVTLADSVDTLEVDLRTRVKRLGAQEKAKRKKCNVRFSIIMKTQHFRKNYMKVGGRHDASKDLESSCGWVFSYGEVEIEGDRWAAAGGKKENDFIVLVHGGHTALKWRRAFHRVLGSAPGEGSRES